MLTKDNSMETTNPDTNSDEWYEVLDELNECLEDMYTRYVNSQTCELLITKFRQKAEEFLIELEHEKETIELIRMDR
jgi:hypothetical protein